MSTRTLIINADDLGYDPAVTRGILRAMREGVVSSATFMVNTPHSESAARESTGLALGLHFNLARGVPCDPGFPGALLDAEGLLVEARAKDLSADGSRREAEAQLARFERLHGRKATHIDVHKHLHRHPAVLEGLMTAASSAGLPIRSITAEMRATLRANGVRTNDHFIGDAGTTAYWTEAQLEADLAALPREGVIELMCHPGYAPQTVKSGYAEQREVELETFLGPRAKQLLDQHGLTPATFEAAR